MPNPHISIIIPAHNEERRIGVAIERWLHYLWSTSMTYEIIVVANGCTDRTVEIAEHYRREGEPVIVHEHLGRGKGLAVRTGMLMAHGKWRYMADADLACPPEALADFLSKAGEGFPLVIGSREMQGANTRTTFKRWIIGRVWHALTRMLVPEIYVQDTQCGFKLVREDAAGAIFRKMKLDGLAFDVEMLYLAFRLKFPVYELGIPWTHDHDTRIRLLADSLQMFRDLTLISRLHRRPRPVRAMMTPSPEDAPAE